jgi:hypothetical protein
MSHVETTKTIITDLKAMTEAARALGGTLEPATTYNWFGRHVADYPMPEGIAEHELGTCDYKISFPGIHYEVGLKKLPDGTYKPLWDFYGTGRFANGRINDGQFLQNKVGKGCGLLIDQYQHYAAKNRLKPGQRCWKIDSAETARHVSALTGHKIPYAGKLLTIATAA